MGISQPSKTNTMNQFFKLAFFLGLISLALAGSSKNKSKCEKFIDGKSTNCKGKTGDDLKKCVKPQCDLLKEFSVKEFQKCINDNKKAFDAEGEESEESAKARLDLAKAGCDNPELLNRLQ